MAISSKGILYLTKRNQNNNNSDHDNHIVLRDVTMIDLRQPNIPMVKILLDVTKIEL